MTHGTTTGYTNGGCRCYACSEAMRDYQREYRRRKLTGDPVEDGRATTYELVGRLLDELAPFGLTDDCPARQRQHAA